MAESVPDALVPPRRLPFNRRCSGERALSWTSVSFAEARGIRGALGGTVNDVMLTVLGGAVGRYCRLHGQDTSGRTMRVMVPVNVRASDQGGDLGNQVSVLPVQVPLHFEDHGDRLRAIRASTHTLKDGRVAEGVSLLTNLSGTVPPPLQAALGSVATSPFPVFNIVCTNVPGPQIPLYALDRRLVAYYPHVPVGHEMGVCCAIFSYDQQLFIGLNSDVGACPDVDALRDLWVECFVEMRELAGVEPVERVAIREQRAQERDDARTGGKRSAAKPRRKATSSKEKARARKKTSAR